MRQSLNKYRFFKFLPISLIILMLLFACSDGGGTTTPAAQPTAAPSQAQPTVAPSSQTQATSVPSQAQAAATTPPSAPMPEAPPEKIAVVTTTNIVADWAQVIGGDRVDVFSLLPVGADPHAFQPGARDVTAIADADLVLSVGLGLEESWLHELLVNAARDESAIVELTDVIDPIEFGATHAEEVELIEAISHVIHEVEDGEISAEEGLGEIVEAIEEAEEDEDHHGHEHEEDEHDEDHEHEEDEHDEDHEHEEDEHDEDHEHEEDEHDEDHEHEEDEHDEDHEHEEDEDPEGHGHGDERQHLSDMVLRIIAQVEAGQFDADEAIEEIEHLAEEGEDAHEGHGHGTYDPHFWFDPLRVKSAINDIAARLSVLDPDGRDAFESNASAFNAELDELHSWIEEQVAAIDEDRRLLVTSHDSLGYFANLYHFEVVGVILSTTTEVEPTAADLAELSHEIEESGVPAIFGETTVSERIASSIADEVGVELVRLYSGSLGAEGSGADTYLGMFRANVERIVNALK